MIRFLAEDLGVSLTEIHQSLPLAIVVTLLSFFALVAALVLLS